MTRLEQDPLDGQTVPRLDLDAALPPEAAAACREIANWIQIAVEVVVSCLLAHASAAVGNTRWVTARQLSVPLSLHFLTSLPSGSGKSQVRRYLRRAVKGIERAVLARRLEADREREDHELTLNAWRKRAGKDRTPDTRPKLPALDPRGGPRATYLLSEATLEGVIATIGDSPRGILWSTDEAPELVGMLGAYGEGRRSLDAARLRRLTESEPIEAHRSRSNADPVRHIPLPWLALDVDVQPGVLAGLFTAEDRSSGLLARILYHAPPSMQGKREYRDPPPPPSEGTLALLRARLEALWEISLTLDEGGAPRPEELPVDGQAEGLWVEELERLEKLYGGANEGMVGILGHARGRILRLAGALTLLRDPRAVRVEREDMARAIVHMRYHVAHAARLLDLLGRRGSDVPSEGGEQRGLEEWIDLRGGSATVRDLTHGLRRFRGERDAAEAELDSLVQAGRGTWEYVQPGPRGGPPSQQFRLNRKDGRAVTVTTTPQAGCSNGGCGDGDGLCDPSAGDGSPTVDPPSAGTAREGPCHYDPLTLPNRPNDPPCPGAAYLGKGKWVLPPGVRPSPSGPMPSPVSQQ